MADQIRNFAYSTVAVAPSPALSGTSLTLQAGAGANFAVGNAVVWPAGVDPLSSNAEIVRVTAVATDTLTITRAQEGTTAQSISANWQIQQGVTAALLAEYAALSGATFTGSIAAGGGTNTSGSTTVSSPTVTSGAAFTPSATNDSQVYFQVNATVAGSYTLTLGPSTGAENTVGSAVAMLLNSDDLVVLRVPAGWKVVLTLVSLTLGRTTVVTC